MKRSPESRIVRPEEVILEAAPKVVSATDVQHATKVMN